MKQDYKKRAIFAGIGGILSIIALSLFIVDFVTLKMGSLENGFSGFELAFDGENIFTDYGVNGEGMYTFFSLAIVAGFALGGIGEMVRCLLIYYGKINMPKKQEQSRRNAILLCVSVVIVSFIPLILNLFILKTTGFNANPLAQVGIGAILTGIIGAIGCLCQMVPFVLNAFKEINNEETAEKIKKD